LVDLEAYRIYRRVFTSLDDGLVAWWYLGATLCTPEGVPPIPGLQAETVMIYRTTSVNETCCTIDWWEIGYFRDPVTGEVASQWLNPLTGVLCKAPRRFEEGPAQYRIQATDHGVTIGLVQPAALVHSVDATLRHAHGQVHLWQTERKSRGFPLPDGSLPDPSSAAASPAVTELSVYARETDLASAAPSVPSAGSYTFALSMLPDWMSFGDMAGHATVYGWMQKATLEPPLNATGWARLQVEFPEHFKDGVIQPRWQAAGASSKGYGS
jgi:hypothetical protein